MVEKLEVGNQAKRNNYIVDKPNASLTGSLNEGRNMQRCDRIR